MPNPAVWLNMRVTTSSDNCPPTTENNEVSKPRDVESRLRQFLADAKNASAGNERGLPEARVQEMLRLAARRKVDDPEEIYRLFVEETVQRASRQENGAGTSTVREGSALRRWLGI